MPQFSAFTSFGFFEFSSQPSLHEQFYKLLPQLWGSQHDMTEVPSYDESKLYAVAGMCAVMVMELNHAGNQANPLTAYDLLPLLENDFLLAPGPKDDLTTRQNAVAAAMLLPGGAKASNIVNSIRKLIGSAFLAYVPNPAGHGNQTVVPSNPGAGPGAFKDVRIPARFLQLVDPVASLGSVWCAYEALDTTTLPSIVWSPGANFSQGQLVLPTVANAGGFFFACSGAGATGATEPVWPTVVGQAVVDGSVTWTCVSTVAPALVAGDVVVVDAGNTSQMEKVTVTAVSNTPPASSNTTPGNGYLYFQATFTKSHDVAAPLTTGTAPYWWSTQRLNFLVLTLAGATDAPTRAKADRQLGKILRGVDTWALVAPTSTTLTGGTLGPFSAGMGMGTSPLGVIPYSNSN
jgi:hypothetical protein